MTNVSLCCSTLAGVRDQVVEDIVGHPRPPDVRYFILPEPFLSVQQAIGFSALAPRETLSGEKVVDLLAGFVAERIQNGVVGRLLEQFGKTNSLEVAKVETENKMKICVFGCGAMGSVYAARFAAAGHSVFVVDLWQDHVDAINKNGLRLQGGDSASWGDRTVRNITATTRHNTVVSDGRLCDLVVIATKASGVADAARYTAALLKPTTGAVLTIQNGLGAGDRIREWIPAEKILLGIASNFGARLVGPGHAEHKSMKLICLGDLDLLQSKSNSRARLTSIAAAWESAGFEVKVFDDIRVPIYEKFIINCAWSGICTLTGFTVGSILDSPPAFRVALNCAQEAFEVAHAQKIPFQDPLLQRAAAELESLGVVESSGDGNNSDGNDGKNAKTLSSVEAYIRQFGATVRGAKPSMLQDFEAGRRGEIDAINGAVEGEGAKVGVLGPVNKTVADAVRAKESVF